MAYKKKKPIDESRPDTQAVVNDKNKSGDFFSEREKKAAKLKGAGLSVDQAREQAGRQLTAELQAARAGNIAQDQATEQRRFLAERAAIDTSALNTLATPNPDLPNKDLQDQSLSEADAILAEAKRNVRGDVNAGRIQKALQSAGAGLVGGAVAGGVPGAVVGGVSGALVGGITGGNDLAELKEEYAQLTQAEYKGYTKDVRALTALVNDINAGITSPEEGMALLQFRLKSIDNHERRLKAIQEKDWLAKAKPELEDIQTFNTQLRQSFIRKVQAAIAAPNPNAIETLPQEPTQ